MSELQAGPELDAIVAQRVMSLVPCDGWEKINFGSGGGPALRKFCRHDDGACYSTVTVGSVFGRVGGCPAYSTSIAAAWQVVERMEGLGYDWAMHSALYGVEARFMPLGSDQGGWVLGDGAPRAICLAALAVLEGPA